MISVITCSNDTRKFDAVAAMWRSVFGSEPWEIVGVGDAKSNAEGYLRGMGTAKGEFLIFAHDDIEILGNEFVSRLKNHFQTYDLLGVAGTSRLVSPLWVDAGPPYIFGQVANRKTRDGEITGYFINVYGVPAPCVGGIKSVDGVFIAVRREVLNQVQFDAVTFDGFHMYDVDFCIRAHQAGFRLGVACDLNLVHFSSGDFNSEACRIYGNRLLQKHPKVFDLQSIPGEKKLWSSVTARTREEAIKRMTPEHWKLGKGV